MKVEEEFRDDEGSSAETISSEGEGVSDTHGHSDDVTQIRGWVGITDIYWTFGQEMNL